MKSYIQPQPRILVVEDDALALEALAYILEYEGYSVATARDGKRGLDILHQSPRPCAVVLDLGLPIVDGFEFIRRQNEDPEMAGIPVIVITASYAPVVPEAAAILPKPLDINELKEVLADCCTGVSH
jgi:CheY-like chemotaxis protein